MFIYKMSRRGHTNQTLLELAHDSKEQQLKLRNNKVLRVTKTPEQEHVKLTQQPQWTKGAFFLSIMCLPLFMPEISWKVDAARYVGLGTVDSRYGSKHEAVNSIHPGSSDLSPALNEFSHHTVIRLEMYHRKNKRVIRSTLESKNGLHVSQITLSYFHDGRKVLIDLKRNDKLLPDEHFLRYQNSNTKTGHVVKQNFTKNELSLCHYQGSIRGKPDSMVAVSTCYGRTNGVVFDGMDSYFIYSGNDGHLHGEHYLLRHVDILNRPNLCGYRDNDYTGQSNDHVDDLEVPWMLDTSAENPANKKRTDVNEFQRILRYKRSYADNNMIRGPYNSNNHSSYVELIIVVDNKLYKAYGENTKKIHQHCKDLANIINALYVPLNIFVALVGVVIWNESNEIEFNSDGDVTLRNFLNYRRNKLVHQHPNDNAQLLTKETFNGGVVGKALKGPICTHVYSGGVSMEHSSVKAVVATTMAHEMGHNFGMEHDTPDCKCREEKCIMSASSTSIVPVHWSSCSIDQLNIAFSRGMNYCLRNRPSKLFDSPQCGNGFVEPGEQCDCGLPQYCENTCCDPHTCMLHSNASCATGECCDLSTCRPKLAGMECRGANSECDLPEYCTGESEYCPANVFKRDTESCDEKRAYCFDGSCRSHSNQCRILWGPTGESSEHCYHKNVEGKRTGNCGLNRVNNTYTPCERENVDCGLLHCRHLNERLEFGMESAAELSYSFSNHGANSVPCRTALVDLGLQSIDPGLAPNGAKCGIDKMCVNQKCRSVNELRAVGFGKACKNNCSGYGSCNSRGNCHCDRGFSGPDCTMPGHGGSPDSGPATNPSSNAAFQRFLYIFFFAVLPIMAFFGFFIYYCRNHPIFLAGKFTANVFKSTNSAQPSPSGGPASPSAANGTLQKSTPSSTADMNSALLKSPCNSGGDQFIENGLFGKFKGFTLRPLYDTNMFHGANVAYVQPTVQQDSNTVPARAAPPPPVKSESVHEINKHNSTLQRRDIKLKIQPNPALPPPNPGSQAPPLISIPMLDNSTISMRMQGIGNEDNFSLIVPPYPKHLKNAATPSVPLHSDRNLNIKRDGTIRRIASFLRMEEKQKQQNLPQEKIYIERDKLRQMEISSPIAVALPQGESSNSDSESTAKEQETKNLVKRAQSMRSPSNKSNIPTFGSMRQNSNGDGRPKSSVTNQASVRPKNPPPRPPPFTNTSSATSFGYQLKPGVRNHLKDEHAHDVCEFVDIPLANINKQYPTGTKDHIYSFIEEIPPAAQTLKRSDLVRAEILSVEGVVECSDMGLLSEIVSEIEKRTGDSIYSGESSSSRQLSTKKEPENVDKFGSTLSTTAPTVKACIPVFSKAPVTTYSRPALFTTPVARVTPSRFDISSTNGLSSFKTQTLSSTNIVRNSTVATTSAESFPNSSSHSAGGVICNQSSNKSLVVSMATKTSSATINKPKPLSAKYSFMTTKRKEMGIKNSKTNSMGTPRAGPTVKKGNIA